MINYENVCKRLDELMVELLEKGFTVPEHLFSDLKSARSLISVYRSNPQELDLAMESSPLLQIVEMNLLIIAETELSKDYADEWQRKIIAAYQGQSEDGTNAKAAVFVPGVPKSEHWVRLKISEITIDEEFSRRLKELNLTSKPQADEYLLIHGKKEDVKTFLKELRHTHSD